MYNLMKHKYLFFAISLLVILPGLFSLWRYGLRLSIDFTGGSLLEIQDTKVENKRLFESLKIIYHAEGSELASMQKTGDNAYILRSKEIDSAKKSKIFARAQKELGKIDEVRFETVGPVIGKELTLKAVQAVGLASLAIVLYIAYAFREVPKPYSPWKFGVTAVIALLHDVLVVVGIFSLLGHFKNVEIDALFVTAILTVIGFSVHDTIVVYDRIRENLRKTAGKVGFSQVVDESLLETLGRSLTTSLTVLFTLLALILFGGESIRWFVVALFVGIFSGTYSSIFNAAPLLVLWEEKSRKK